jgi:hypothetical protein
LSAERRSIDLSLLVSNKHTRVDVNDDSLDGLPSGDERACSLSVLSTGEARSVRGWRLVVDEVEHNLDDTVAELDEGDLRAATVGKYDVSHVR